MALTSRSGLWRLRMAKIAMQNKVSPLKLVGLGKEKDFWMATTWGKFHCPDNASPLQFAKGWERRIKEIVAGRTGLFVDVGANIGFYSILAAKKGNHVIALEPNQKAWACLVDNVYANGVEALVDPYPVAAWSERADVRFREGRHTDISRVGEGEGTVKAVPLDLLLHGRVPKLIKIDAEGAEAEIFKGMPDTLAAHPWIIFEALTRDALEKCYPYLTDYHISRIDRTNYFAA